MPTDTQKFAAMSLLPTLEAEIKRLESEMAQKQNTWVDIKDVPGRPDKKFLKLKAGLNEAECRAEYDALRARLVSLQERRVEIRRELNLDLLDLEESLGH